MARENPGQTLQATALVHEAYLRLIEQRLVSWKNRAHFYAISSQMMRRILVDRARARHYEKRGGKIGRVSLDEALIMEPEKSQTWWPLTMRSRAWLSSTRARVR
jgi:RNA polymerase sigma factor (TIGR02999 family)